MDNQDTENYSVLYAIRQTTQIKHDRYCKQLGVKTNCENPSMNILKSITCIPLCTKTRNA